MTPHTLSSSYLTHCLHHASGGEASDAAVVVLLVADGVRVIFFLLLWFGLGRLVPDGPLFAHELVEPRDTWSLIGAAVFPLLVGCVARV